MKKNDLIEKGKKSYQTWKKKLESDPQFQSIYQEEAAKKELWLQLVEARQASGLTQNQLAKRLGVSQAQVARMEKMGYDAYTLTSLRRYVNALGEGFSLKIIIEEPHIYSSAQ